jgi:hypothetical protein
MKYILAFISICFIAACSFESYNQREIEGQWYSESWTSSGEETGYRAWMAFEQDSTYRALFNNRREQGKYWIDGHRLYTDSEDGEPIKVKIASLDEQSMVIEMNRGGNKETITFGKGTVNRLNEAPE